MKSSSSHFQSWKDSGGGGHLQQQMGLNQQQPLLDRGNSSSKSSSPTVNPPTHHTPKKVNDKRRNCMDLSKALCIMGYGGWSELVPDEDIVNEDKIKQKLDGLLFTKTLEIKAKMEALVRRKARAEKMSEGPLKRRLQYQVEQQYDKVFNSPGDEERTLHEAYQFLMREFEARQKMEQIARAAAATEGALRANGTYDLFEPPSGPSHHRVPSPRVSPKQLRRITTRGSETRSILRGGREVFDAEKPLSDPQIEETLRQNFERLYS